MAESNAEILKNLEAVGGRKEEISSVADKEEQERLSDIIKGVHKHLRAELSTGISDTELWSTHLQDRCQLEEYARAMHALAVGPWSKHGSEGGRIGWCIESCREYFREGLENVVEKDLRRLAHGNPTQLEPGLLPKPEEVPSLVRGFTERRLNLLDVGSCYNPFEQYKEFNVVPIDISPAVESVYQCDFLNVAITPSPTVITSRTVTSLAENSFDVVVFSLLLSYLPSTTLRMQCCINAHRLLQPHGLLLVVTPDSSHQNKHVDMMKSWRSALEALGFQRWRYLKDTHLHCMAYRKTKLVVDYDATKLTYHSNLYITQD